MKRTVLIAILGLLAAILVAAASPAAARGATVVPPDNSGVNQYTETYPSAGGDAVGGGGRTPAQALGEHAAHRLRALGPEGESAASLAAATAPPRAVAGGDGNGEAGRAGNDRQAPSRGNPVPAGSSGLSEVLGQATGTSGNGGLGPLLPVIVLASIASAAAYAWRRRTS